MDWDRKLSDLASLNKDDIHGGMQLLQKVRQAALGTPAAMLRILVGLLLNLILYGGLELIFEDETG